MKSSLNVSVQGIVFFLLILLISIFVYIFARQCFAWAYIDYPMVNMFLCAALAGVACSLLEKAVHANKKPSKVAVILWVAALINIFALFGSK